jgi:TolB protein
MHRKAIWTIGLGLLLASAGAAAREYIKITDPNFRAFPIAVPDFKDLGGGATEAVRTGIETLRNDLSLIGLFKVLDPKSFIAKPGQEGLTGASINFADWINVGAEGLVKVGLQKVGTELTMDGHFFDVATGKELLHKQYKGPDAAARTMAHKFADSIVQQLTGAPSVFFTRIVFAKRVGGDAKQICVMDFDGFNEQCVVKNGALNLLPAWAADGKGVYYTSYINGQPQLFKLDLATGKSVMVSKFSGLNVGAAAAPDGKAIALTLS